MTRSCSPSTGRISTLTGGLERWLYRLVRKHGGRQDGGWSFDFEHLHAKSGSLSPLKHFAFDLRDIVRRQPLPGYRLVHRRGPLGAERLDLHAHSRSIRSSALCAVAISPPAWGQAVKSSRAIGDRTYRAIGDPILVLSGTKIDVTYWRSTSFRARNFTNLESFGFLLTGTLVFRRWG